MRIRLEKVGPYTCLPLPGPAAEAPGFAAGEEVEVIWDAGHSQLIARALTEGSRPPAEVVADISEAVEEFIGQYGEALSELASL